MTDWAPGHDDPELVQEVVFTTTDDLGDTTDWSLIFVLPKFAHSAFGKASDAQKQAIRDFYHLDFAALDPDTAHILLAIRGYARAISDEVAGPMMDKRNLIARMVAMRILHTDWMAAHAVRESERAFDDDLEEIPCADPAMRHEVQQFLLSIFGGLDRETLKPARAIITPMG